MVVSGTCKCSRSTQLNLTQLCHCKWCKNIVKFTNIKLCNLRFLTCKMRSSSQTPEQTMRVSTKSGLGQNLFYIFIFVYNVTRTLPSQEQTPAGHHLSCNVSHSKTGALYIYDVPLHPTRAGTTYSLLSIFTQPHITFMTLMFQHFGPSPFIHYLGKPLAFPTLRRRVWLFDHVVEMGRRQQYPPEVKAEGLRGT